VLPRCEGRGPWAVGQLALDAVLAQVGPTHLDVAAVAAEPALVVDRHSYAEQPNCLWGVAEPCRELLGQEDLGPPSEVVVLDSCFDDHCAPPVPRTLQAQFRLQILDFRYRAANPALLAGERAAVGGAAPYVRIATRVGDLEQNRAQTFLMLCHTRGMRSAKSLSPAELVVAAMKAVNDHDPAALSRLSRRDFVAFPASPFLGGDGRPYSGRDGLARWLDDLASRWSGFSVTVHDLREQDDRVFCRAVMTVTPKRTAATVSHEMYLVLDTRRGQLAAVRSYGFDRQAALSAWSGGRG
jgi:hypothetical protein